MAKWWQAFHQFFHIITFSLCLQSEKVKKGHMCDEPDGKVIICSNWCWGSLKNTSSYPWRCLCFGFEQITITFLLRRIKRQFIHIFRTDGRTFIILKFTKFSLVLSPVGEDWGRSLKSCGTLLLPKPVYNTSPCQVIRAKLNCYSIS